MSWPLARSVTVAERISTERARRTGEIDHRAVAEEDALEAGGGSREALGALEIPAAGRSTCTAREEGRRTDVSAH